jgi:hypothetical protein
MTIPPIPVCPSKEKLSLWKEKKQAFVDTVDLEFDV